MKPIAKTLFVVGFFLSITFQATSQILLDRPDPEREDSIKNDLVGGSYFGLYKDNYFSVGTVFPGKPDKHNSDAKFQLSIAQRLTNDLLPWNTYLFLMFTEKVFWNIFENSMPMRDLNFNPGIGVTKPFFVKGRYSGKMTLMVEHESNGRDGDASRSWNKISLSASAMVTDWLLVHAKYWYPIVDGMNNKDLLRYTGLFQVGAEVSARNRRFIWSAVFMKRKTWRMNWNVDLQFAMRILKQDNQYLFFQFYNGYGESLLDYKQYRSRLRVGICIKPRFFSEF